MVDEVPELRPGRRPCPKCAEPISPEAVVCPHCQSDLTPHGTSVEALTKLLALAGIVTYAVGLLAVNGYLSQFGFTDYSQLKARFVVTGALMLGVIGVGLAALFAVWRLARFLAQRKQGVGGFLSGAILSIPLALIVAVLALGNRKR